MPYLYLIRHPLTHVDPTRPSAEWDLSEQGHQQADALLEAPFWKGVAALFSSEQMKALGPARMIGERYGIPVTPVRGIAEVRRDKQVYRTNTSHQLILQEFFKFPDKEIEGWESADSALKRFTQSAQEIVKKHPNESIALLSHGTILTLYTANLDQQPPTLARWIKIGFATVATVDPVTNRLLTPFEGPPYAGIPAPGSEIEGKV